MTLHSDVAGRALASTAMTPLVLTPRPFARADEVRLCHAPEGLTVAQMLDLMQARGDLDPALRPLVRVTAGDQVLPRELWDCVRAKPGVILFVDVQPQGSDPLRAVLTLAVIALSVWTGGLAAGAFGPAAGAAASAAVAIGGTLLINALVPIQQPGNPQPRQLYSLDGASNAATPFNPIPVVLGQRRVYPPRCANWYTTTIANVVYLRQLFQPSVGWVDRASPRIGDTDLASYTGATIRWNTLPSDGLSLSMFSRTPGEDNLGPLTFKQSDGWSTRTMPIDGDSISLDLEFGNGLFGTDKASGKLENFTVQIEVRYGAVGGDPAAATAAPIGAAGVLTFTRKDNSPYRQEFAWAVARGQYDVHVRRLTADSTTNTVSDIASWVCLRAFRDEAPIRKLAGVPWVELELQATDQLSGVPNNFNFIATSMVPQAGVSGPGDLIATRNPGDLFLALLYPPFSDLDLDADERDYAAIYAWRQLCADKAWKCDLVETGESSVGDLLVRAAAAGRARPSMTFGAVSVVVDWEKPVVRQVFSPRTVQGFKGEVLYPEDVHGLQLQFANQDKAYQDDTVTVFAPGYDESTAVRYDSMQVTDKTDPDEVQWEGARVIAERIARPERFTFTQDIEYLVVGEGDRAWLMHHVALVGQVSGRVTAQLFDAASNLVGLKLDEAVIMETGKSYDIAWRGHYDGDVGLADNTAALQFLAGERHLVYFSGAAPANPPQVDDLVTVGEHLLETLDVVVDVITPKAGLTAEVQCIPYAPELQHVGEVEIVSYRTGASKPPALPGAYVGDREVATLRALVQTAHQSAQDVGQTAFDAFTDGVFSPGEKSLIVPQINALINARASLRAEADALGLTVGALNAERVAYENAATALDNLLATLTAPVAWNDASDVTVIASPATLRVCIENAQTADANLRAKIASTVRVLTGVTDTTPPSAPSGLTASAASFTVILNWTNPSDLDLDHVEVWENTSNAQPNPITQPSLRLGTAIAVAGKPGGFARTGLATGVTRWYWVRAIDHTGNASAFNATSGVSATTVAIATVDIADDSITAPKILAGTITGDRIGAGQITAGNIAASTITGSEIAAGTLTAGNIQAGTITATEIIGGAITNVTYDDQLSGVTLTGTAQQVFSTNHTTQVGGAPHAIAMNVNCAGAATQVSIAVQLLRDGSNVGGETVITIPGPVPATHTPTIYDAPPAGAHTYSINARTLPGSGSGSVCAGASALITELKR